VVCFGVELVLWGLEEALVSESEAVVGVGVDDGVLEVLVVEGVVEGVDVVDAEGELVVVGVVPPVAVPCVVFSDEVPSGRRPPICRSAMAPTFSLFLSIQVDWATESNATATSSCWIIFLEYMVFGLL
jgi:hypothetical protein